MRGQERKRDVGGHDALGAWSLREDWLQFVVR